MSTEFKEVGYGNDFTPDTLPNLYQMIEERRSKGLPLYGKALLSEPVEGSLYKKRVGLNITHDGGILDDEHVEYEE